MSEYSLEDLLSHIRENTSLCDEGNEVIDSITKKTDAVNTLKQYYDLQSNSELVEILNQSSVEENIVDTLEVEEENFEHLEDLTIPPAYGEDGWMEYVMEQFNSAADHINLHPNPVGELLHVDFGLSYFDFKIIDIHGKIYGSGNKRNSDLIIDVSELLSGYYILQLTHNDKSFVTSFIKQ